MNTQKITKEIADTLWVNDEKIAEELWAPDLDGWKVWICGSLGSEKISFSNPLTGGTSPNPANYTKKDWIIKQDYITDIIDMSQTEIDEATKSGDIIDIIQRMLDFDELANSAVFPADKGERV